MSKTIILDNGAHTAKTGYTTDKDPKIIPNTVIKAKNVRNRIFIGDQIDDCKDLSGLYYLLAFQKGYLVNWEIQRQVWDHIFSRNVLSVDFDDTNIIVTEPYFNFPSVQEGMSETFFEEYQFQSVLRCNAGHLSQTKYHKENAGQLCCLVVETGYSFTHVVPYCKGKKMKNSIKRMNVGGKVLTNHLKEIISYRQLMVMDETYVMNQVKEDVCYVAQDFYKDMEIAKLKGKDNTVVRDYILPDYTHIKRGHVRDLEEIGNKAQGSEQIIRLGNERFSVPEVIFHPSDIGIQEMGLPETIIYAINSLPEEMHPHFYNNIVITGGNALLPGFKERLYTEVRAMAPCLYDVKISCSDNPMLYPFEGGVVIAQSPNFKKQVVTRADYEEHGHNICLEKFDV